MYLGFSISLLRYLHYSGEQPRKSFQGKEILHTSLFEAGCVWCLVKMDKNVQ